MKVKDLPWCTSNATKCCKNDENSGCPPSCEGLYADTHMVFFKRKFKNKDILQMNREYKTFKKTFATLYNYNADKKFYSSKYQ